MRQLIIDQNPYIGSPLICRICSAYFHGTDPQATLYSGSEEGGYVCGDCFDAIVICGLAGALERAECGVRTHETQLAEAKGKLAAWRAAWGVTIRTASRAFRGAGGSKGDPPAMEMEHDSKLDS